MKKVLALLIALLIVTPLFGAFAEEKGDSWIAERTIVGRAFVDDIGASLPDNQTETALAKYIREQTGITFRWEYTSGNNDLEVLTTMLATGDIPDVIISYCDNSGRPEFSVLKQAIQAGMFCDIEPYLADTKVLKQYLDDDWLPADTAANVIRNDGYPDDGIYMLHMRIPRYPGSRGNDSIALYINMDVANAVNIKPEDITTTESLIAAAEKIRAANLTDQNGAAVMPIGPTVWGGRLQSEFYRSAAISNERETLYGVVDGQVKHVSGTALLEQQVRYIREMLEKGLIDPEVFTMESARAKEGLVVGHYAFMVMNPNNANNQYLTNGIEWLPCYKMTNRDGSDAIPVAYKTGYNIVAVNANSENPGEIVKFIDYMSSYEGKLAWMYGVEGYHYDMDENGMPVFRQEWMDLYENDSNKAMQEGIAGLGSDWGYIGNTDIANFDDFGEYSIRDRQDTARAEHKLYIMNYSNPTIEYFDGSGAATFFSMLPESTQIKLEQFIEPSYHADIFVKACFADTMDNALKILNDYRDLLVRQGIEEFEGLLQDVYDTTPETIHFN